MSWLTWEKPPRHGSFSSLFSHPAQLVGAELLTCTEVAGVTPLDPLQIPGLLAIKQLSSFRIVNSSWWGLILTKSKIHQKMLIC